VVEAIGSEARSRFTGTIHKVTIDLEERKAAGTDAVNQAIHEAARRKTLSD
jgi:hypothetical protein